MSNFKTWKPQKKVKWTFKKVLLLLSIVIILFMACLWLVLMPIQLILMFSTPVTYMFKYGRLIDFCIQLMLFMLYLVILIKIFIFIFSFLKKKIKINLRGTKKISINSYNKKINESITFFLNEHKMFDTDKEGNYIGNWNIEYQLLNEKLYLNFYKNGGRYNENITELDSALESLFGMVIIEKQDTRDLTSYIMELEYENELSNLRFKEAHAGEPIQITDTLVWDYIRFPHAAISGTTGSGKSAFLNYLLFELRKRNATIHIIDLKGDDLVKLSLQLNLKYAIRSHEVYELTNDVVKEMEERYEIIRGDSKMSTNFLTYNMKPIFLVCDELATLGNGDTKEEIKEIKKIRQNIRTLILEGRQAGVYVIISVQQLNSQNVATELRDCLFFKILFGNASYESTKMVFGDIDRKLDTLPERPGYGYLRFGLRGQPIKLRGPHIDGEVITSEFEKLESILNTSTREQEKQ